MKKSKHRDKPPFVGSMFLRLPGGAEVKVPLPKAEGYEIGARVYAEGKYKSQTYTFTLIRVSGGWDIFNK